MNMAKRNKSNWMALGIIGAISIILGGIIFMLPHWLFYRSPTDEAHSYGSILESAIDSYRLENGGSFPTENNIQDVWHVYIRHGQTNDFQLDPWGNKWSYSANNVEYEIRSAGPDKIFKTKDDIVLLNE
jgi:hypothetical protein